MRHEGLEKESSLLKNTLKAQKELIQKFKDEARTFMQANLNDYKKLKEKVIDCYKTYSVQDIQIEEKQPDQMSDTTASSKAKKSKKSTQKASDDDVFRVQFVKREHLEEALRQLRQNLINSKRFHKS